MSGSRVPGKQPVSNFQESGVASAITEKTAETVSSPEGTIL